MLPIEKTAYLCGECKRKAYLDKEQAENCCKPKICECGAELDPKWYRTVCEPCHTKRLFEKAEKLTEWDGWVYWDGHGFQDGYFSDVDSLRDYCEDEEIEPPEWVFVCESMRHELNIDNAIEQMLDDAYDGAGDHLVDEKELRIFVDEWNKRQNIISYYPDYGKVLLLN